MELTVAMLVCGPQLEVALGGGGMGVPSVVRLAGGSPRSTLLMAAVDLLMEDAGREPAELGVVVVSRGPGSFTGIRAGLASAAGLATATGCRQVAYDSLLAHAARVEGPATVWAAQPGRRGELYVRRFRVEPGGAPTPAGDIGVVPVRAEPEDGGWIAPELLDLGPRRRLVAERTGAEALLELVRRGVPAQPGEPVYVEGPPIHRPDGGRRAT